MFCIEYVVKYSINLAKEDFMKTQRNILIAFILNLSFSVFEVVGGFFTGSIAIVSDALHDAGDALSIGLSYFLEKKSKKAPDENYTYGYRKYSVLGSLITTMILLCGSVVVIAGAVERLFNPQSIDYSGMIIFAVVGMAVNFLGAMFTHSGDSLNQKAINLHMLEDLLGWAVVLVGAIVMNFTDLSVLDPLMSIGVALFIFINSLKNLKEVLDIFLEKVPENISLEEIEKKLLSVEGVEDVHHIHVRSFDGNVSFASMHIVTEKDPIEIKEKVREVLEGFLIFHSTLELESPLENCGHKHCHIEEGECHGHHHHHHHHH